MEKEREDESRSRGFRIRNYPSCVEKYINLLRQLLYREGSEKEE